MCGALVLGRVITDAARAGKKLGFTLDLGACPSRFSLHEGRGEHLEHAGLVLAVFCVCVCAVSDLTCLRNVLVAG